jgi:hypothetical protein
LNAICMLGMAAMGKIHSRHIHARFEQPLQNSRIARCRTDGADDFGMSKIHRHNRREEREIPGWLGMTAESFSQRAKSVCNREFVHQPHHQVQAFRKSRRRNSLIIAMHALDVLIRQRKRH